MDKADFADGALRLTIDAGIARLELNQPARRNAISQAMWLALPEAVAAIEASAARAVILAGSGDQAFSAGADISEFERIYADPPAARAYNAAVRKGQAVVRTCRLPVIAEIRGFCMGGGLGLALACDLRFAASNARFAITPAKLGLAYSFQDTRQLVEKVGPARAKDILFSARTLPAAEALDIGLIDRIIDPAELHAVTEAYGKQVIGLSSVSVALSKAIVNAIADGAAMAPAHLDEAVEATFRGPDFQEGYRAFLDKRRPTFGT